MEKLNIILQQLFLKHSRNNPDSRGLPKALLNSEANNKCISKPKVTREAIGWEGRHMIQSAG